MSHKKIICGWTDKKKYLIYFRVLKFYVRHGMIVEKIHEIISLKQSTWLKNYIKFNTQQRNKAKNSFEKDCFKLNIRGFYIKILQNIRYRLKTEFIENCEFDRIIKQQSKLTFNVIHKPYTYCYNYTFKQNEVIMTKAI